MSPWTDAEIRDAIDEMRQLVETFGTERSLLAWSKGP
jgi:hypothetical protein